MTSTYVWGVTRGGLLGFFSRFIYLGQALVSLLRTLFHGTFARQHSLFQEKIEP